MVVVKEEKVLVGRQGPQASWGLSFGGVHDIPNLNHGFEAKGAGKVSTSLLILFTMHSGEAVLDGADSLLEFCKVVTTTGFDGRDNVLVEHVDEAESFHLDGTNVVVNKARLTGLALRLGHYLHVTEKLNVLRGRESADSIDTRVNAPDPTVSKHLLVRFVIVVTVEDDLPVSVEGFCGDLGRCSTGFDLVSELLKRTRR
mmetsp:Transcript_16954/g.32147  ORF Transcript_16954/g.32147 Transcript_16954/m.32147 type:complete len:200 (+) Transcript_16954:401-1000(+)